MYEDRPEKDTPQAILDDLREYGGQSPSGLSIWRLVRAENCRIHCFGQRNHINSESVKALNDYSRPTDIVPERIEEGDFWIPRYRAKGWILQRWFPASTWGTREQWEGEKAQDGRKRLLAAYPHNGDYMLMPCDRAPRYPWKSIAQAGDLHTYIRAYNLQQRSNPANWENQMQAMLAWEQQERDAEAEAFATELEAQYRIGVSALLPSVSTSAQEIRNAISRQSAGGVMLGAAERWG